MSNAKLRDIVVHRGVLAIFEFIDAASAEGRSHCFSSCLCQLCRVTPILMQLVVFVSRCRCATSNLDDECVVDEYFCSSALSTTS